MPEQEEVFDYKQAAIQLWAILDNIDTAEDMFRPTSPESWQAYHTYVKEQHNKRFDIFMSDGYHLFLKNTQVQID